MHIHVLPDGSFATLNSLELIIDYPTWFDR